MGVRIIALLLISLAASAEKARKPAPAARGENQDILLQVTLYADPAGVKEVLGDDLGGHYIVVSVKLESKYGKEIAVDRDDFVLRTDKDGEKTKPFAPSQIAGRGALVVTQTGSGGGMMGEQGGPVFGGGMPGGMGGPMRLPGSGGSIGGGGGGEGGGSEARMDSGKQEKENPLLKVLQEKILPEKKTESSVSGLLYFAMGKQKVKDLELTYGGRENRITMRFKQ